VSISVANVSRTWPDLRRAVHLGVTVLADHHGAAARQLAGPVETRFEGLEVASSDDGAVTLADGLAQFDTTIYREVEAGDHTIVLLRLHAAEHADHAQPSCSIAAASGGLSSRPKLTIFKPGGWLCLAGPTLADLRLR
jgi:flavin reductase (DIM6/NTAB) family NADH-FMN oxidoreductase RutF